MSFRARNVTVSMLWVPSCPFWFRNTGILYEKTHKSGFMLVLLGSVWTNKGGVQASLLCGNNVESLCETGLLSGSKKMVSEHLYRLWRCFYYKSGLITFVAAMNSHYLLYLSDLCGDKLTNPHLLLEIKTHRLLHVHPFLYLPSLYLTNDLASAYLPPDSTEELSGVAEMLATCVTMVIPQCFCSLSSSLPVISVVCEITLTLPSELALSN